MNRRPGGWRRALTAVAAGLLAATTVTACASDEDSAAAPAASGSAAAAFPVSIAHKFGSTTIEKQPERVVTVGWNDQDPVLALGVVPVSTREWFTEYPTYPWVKEALGGKPLPTFSAEINFEAILQQQPDLILAIYETINKETYDKLSRIAPTVIQSADYADEQTPWDVQTLTTGKALGKPAEAQALVAKVNAAVEAAKTANPQFAGKTLVVDFGPEKGQHWLIPAKDPRRALFDALGFAAQSESEDVSEERLDLLDRDVLFVNGATRKDMLASPAFSRLKVATEDRTLYTSFSTPLGGALAYSGPNALLYALEVLVPQLKNATDGDRATAVTDLSNAA
ncbi:iron-siderophore ABC transporter substrate-binding protein [Amorphoplanes nipponensis]|uniref:ABC transporter substrate-binding protein n=1 Tax=Actinoplanes nipponensis TaxID=135950 RepID=A0A919MQT7_9ACTN|nr:ABC transporter substrate-binding protein [Actinoplanes nipponensis]GIE50883.1 ABC transporter substrate-binding protein [Actinoplanes nipponensis]